jgi:hypothetical protein
MQIFNDLRFFANSKSEFPEENLQLDAWKAQIDEVKKHWQSSVAFLQEIAQALDIYGKNLGKTAKQFIAGTLRLQSQSSTNLAHAMMSSAGSAEAVGFAYAKHAGGLLNYLAQKSQEVLEECASQRKRLVEEPSQVMKEVSSAQSTFSKNKTKYSKLCKEAEGALASLDKFKHDPANAYQVNVLKRHEEKARVSTLAVQDMESTLQQSLKQLNSRQDALNDIMTGAQLYLVKSQHRVMQSTVDLFSTLVSTLRRIACARSDQAEHQNTRLSELANITLDLLPATRSKGSTAENLAKSLESRLNSNEERRKMIAAFRQFVVEVTAFDQNLTRALLKTHKAYTADSEFKTLSAAVEAVKSLLEELANFTGDRAKDNSTAADSLVHIIEEQSSLSRSLQATVQRIVRDRSVVEEDLMKEFERVRKGADPQLNARSAEISEKLGRLSSDTEVQVLNCILENTNSEAIQLQALKQILASLLSIDNAVTAKIRQSLDRSSLSLQKLDPAEEFTNTLHLEKRKHTSVQFEEIRNFSIKDFTASPAVSAQSSPSKPSKGAQEEPSDDNAIEKKFGIPSTHVVESFTCALGQKLPLHGRMYVTTSHLCFHSYFNSTTLFGRETKLAIPFAEVLKVEKRTNAMIFDNSLTISTINSEFFFTNFAYRDQAFATIEPLLALSDDKAPQSHEIAIRLGVDSTGKTLSKLLREVKPPHGRGAKPMADRYFQVALLSQPLELRTSIQRVFQLIFSDEGSKFWLSYLALRGDTGCIISAWDPVPPDYYQGVEGDRWISSSCRTASFCHPIKERLPMMPKTCTVFENHMAFWLSKTHFVVEAHIRIEGVTLGDTFITHMRWNAQQREEVVVIDVDYGMEFVKSTMFASKIERSGINEIRESINTYFAPLLSRTVSEGHCVPQPTPIPVVAETWSGSWVVGCAVVLLCVLLLRLQWRTSALELQVAQLQASLLAK